MTKSNLVTTYDLKTNLFVSMFRFISFLFLLVSVHVFAQKPVPELWGQRVHDDAGVLSASTLSQLEQQLKLYEDSTSNQIAVLTTPSLDGEVLEEYSLKVAEKWKLGQESKDNGALLLIVVNDRKMRIEVGYGLEGVLTDAMSNRIIRNEIAPNFRREDYDAGVLAGVSAMIAVIGGEYVADDADGQNDFEDMTTSEKLLIGLFIFGILGLFTFIGLFAGKPGWFLYFFLIPFWALFPTIFLGTSLILLVIYVVAFPLLKIFIMRSSWGKAMSKKMASSSGGSGGRWTSGGGWGGGSSGWSSGGGGFSGGGGSFGGGGSSGSW
jgi:uncharacterized protein